MAFQKLQTRALGKTVLQRGLHAFVLAVLLSGCSLDSNVLWPDDPSDAPYASVGSQDAAIPQLAASPPPRSTIGAAPPPALGTTNFVPPPISSPQATGTFVGQKVSQHRSELRTLQVSINEHNRKLQEIRNVTTANAQRYHGTVAVVTARLQLGTTPGIGQPVERGPTGARPDQLGHHQHDFTGDNRCRRFSHVRLFARKPAGDLWPFGCD
ncbi:MAG TPA: hypothetical protein EYQ81_08660 [Sneathiellales bacterium]|nr:hypothetical protein [Sneathiellales bacterium]